MVGLGLVDGMVLVEDLVVVDEVVLVEVVIVGIDPVDEEIFEVEDIVLVVAVDFEVVVGIDVFVLLTVLEVVVGREGSLLRSNLLILDA